VRPSQQVPLIRGLTGYVASDAPRASHIFVRLVSYSFSKPTSRPLDREAKLGEPLRSNSNRTTKPSLSFPLAVCRRAFLGHSAFRRSRLSNRTTVSLDRYDRCAASSLSSAGPSSLSVAYGQGAVVLASLAPSSMCFSRKTNLSSSWSCILANKGL